MLSCIILFASLLTPSLPETAAPPGTHAPTDGTRRPTAPLGCARAGDERRAPGIPYAASLRCPYLRGSESAFCRFGFSVSLCYYVTACDLVSRRQCAGVESRGRRRCALLRHTLLSWPVPRPRPVLPGKFPPPPRLPIAFHSEINA
jgi:hypothetical protein